MYRFNNVLLDTNRREIRRGSETVSLRPKAFELLVYLIEHRERVVTKQELFEQIWPGVVVGDATLNTCIKSSRQAVGDDGQAQKVIQTRHGHGYRFLAEVEEASPNQEAVPEQVAAPETSPAVHLPRPEAFPASKEHKQARQV